MCKANRATFLSFHEGRVEVNTQGASISISCPTSSLSASSGAGSRYPNLKIPNCVKILSREIISCISTRQHQIHRR